MPESQPLHELTEVLGVRLREISAWMAETRDARDHHVKMAKELDLSIEAAAADCARIDAALRALDDRSETAGVDEMQGFLGYAPGREPAPPINAELARARARGLQHFMGPQAER